MKDKNWRYILERLMCMVCYWLVCEVICCSRWAMLCIDVVYVRTGELCQLPSPQNDLLSCLCHCICRYVAALKCFSAERNISCSFCCFGCELASLLCTVCKLHRFWTIISQNGNSKPCQKKWEKKILKQFGIRHSIPFVWMMIITTIDQIILQ